MQRQQQHKGSTGMQAQQMRLSHRESLPGQGAWLLTRPRPECRVIMVAWAAERMLLMAVTAQPCERWWRDCRTSATCCLTVLLSQPNANEAPEEF